MLEKASPRFYGLSYSEWRPGQWEAIEQIYTSLQTKDIVIVQAPTGAGKSGIALGLLRAMGATGCIITDTKRLQDQYMDEGGWRLRQIRGRGNYDCGLTVFDPTLAYNKGVYQIIPVDEAPCVVGFSCPFSKSDGVNPPDCTYYHDLWEASRVPISIHNYAYWLPITQGGQYFLGNDVIVCDEGHLINKAITSFRSIEILTLPVVLASTKVVCDPVIWRDWAIEALPGIRIKHKNDPNDIDLAKHLRQVEMLADIDPPNYVVKTDINNIVKIVPIWPGKGAFRELFLGKKAKKAVIMTATVLDPDLFTQMLGIEKDEYGYIELTQRFLPYRRPVLYRPVARMNYENMQNGSTLIAVARTIQAIMSDHSGEKGIIHSVSYATSVRIWAELSYAAQRRLIYHDTYTRETAFESFRNSKDLWLMSPSASHGEDFPYDQARVQIIVKMPFPPLTDPWVDARMKSHTKWYDYETMTELWQTIGRVVRAEDDYGVSYVLDMNFERLVKSNKYWVPAGTMEAIQGL